MTRRFVLTAAVLLAASALHGQGPLPTVDQQVTAAVLALPAGMRAGATVLGYRDAGKLVELKAGTNGMICLADDPAIPAFHVACYHESMEPFMARGRALRAAPPTPAAMACAPSIAARSARNARALLSTTTRAPSARACAGTSPAPKARASPATTSSAASPASPARAASAAIASPPAAAVTTCAAHPATPIAR